MIYLQLLNSCLATFGPYFVIYKATSLSSSTGVGMLLMASFVCYILCQLCKTLMLIIVAEWIGYIWILHQLLNLADLPGIYFLLQLRKQSSFDSDTRLIGVGLGWALAETVGQNLVPMLASGPEFTHAIMYRALLSNIQMLSHVTLAALVYMSGKRKMDGLEKYSTLVITMLLCYVAVAPAVFGMVWEMGDGLDTGLLVTPRREESAIGPRGRWGILVGLACVMSVAAMLTKFLYGLSKRPSCGSGGGNGSSGKGSSSSSRATS
eukprot:GHVQ01016127.1.p1 GENE.GHVQ01016127.1~~GHVQ01016127.1.p1  ORF type:complete len:264 (-),score=24.71 GHVQ01016127.1:251-1042(-)